MRVTYLYFTVIVTFTGFVIYETSFGKKAQVVSHWSLTAQVWIQFQANLQGICGG
jgi:hypothetical protein